MRSPFDLGAKQMKDISLRILDVECAACVARLDRALEKLPGVQRAAVNYTAASALITYNEGATDLAAIAARVRRAGFRVPVEEQVLLPAEADAETAAAAADALRAVFGVKDVAVQAGGTLTAYLWPIGVDGRDLAAVCADAGCAVTLGVADTRKTEAAAVVAQLKTAGKEVWMMTGDHARTAEAIAAEVGIDHVLSEVRPDEKAAAIERLRAQGKTVCMVGDGINDTPALAVADCAVAMGGGSDIAIESAGILLPSGNLKKLPELFDISRATIRTIRQNLTWALFYNLVSIPIAALGVLHPSICATAMSASSIGVLMHSLRLKDSDKKERRFPWKKKS